MIGFATAVGTTAGAGLLVADGITGLVAAGLLVADGITGLAAGLLLADGITGLAAGEGTAGGGGGGPRSGVVVTTMVDVRGIQKDDRPSQCWMGVDCHKWYLESTVDDIQGLYMEV